MVSTFYKKNIAEGKLILNFSLAFAIAIRIVYFIFTCPYVIDNRSNTNFIWNNLEPLFTSNIISWATSFISLLCITTFASYLNKRFVLIKIRTSLIASFPLLLFSCHPIFFPMSPEYLSTIAVLISVGITLEAYDSPRKQVCALYVGGLLAIGSLFQLPILFYLPVFLFGLGVVKSLNIKTILAFLIGVIIIYIPLFSYYLFVGQLDLFAAPFIETIDVSNFHSLSFEPDLKSIITLLIILISILTILIQGYNSRYNDKIKVRAYYFFLATMTTIAFISSLFTDTFALMSLFIGMACVSLLAAHLFAQTNTKWLSWYYYIILVLIFIFSLSHLLY